MLRNRPGTWGGAFEDGKGIEQDRVEAYAWYRCAAVPPARAGAEDDIDVKIARDASASLARLLPSLSAAQFEAGEKLAQSYVSAYAGKRAK